MDNKSDLLIVRDPLCPSAVAVKAPAGTASVGDMVCYKAAGDTWHGKVIEVVPCQEADDCSRIIQHLTTIRDAVDIFRRIWPSL